MSGLLRKFKKVNQISWIKTLRFNYQYFGWQGVFGIWALVSRNVILDRLEGQVELYDKKRCVLQIGFSSINIFDAKKQRAIWSNHGEIICSGKCFLGQGTRITNGGTINFGRNATITANTSLACGDYISIGDDCLISWDCLIMDADLHPIYSINQPNIRINENKPIIIGKRVWIG